MSESLENFTNIVKEDIKEAKTLFFSEAFKEEYLKDRREEKELYHQLLLGRNRNQILEEFLLSSGQKKPVLLSAAKTIYQATIMNLDEPLEIKVKREGWGYLVGRIKSDGTFLSLHKNTFQAEDFEDGTLTIYADMKTIPDFCTGRITTSQLYERGNMVLDKMPDDPVKNRIYDLMKLHLSILEGKGDLEEKIPEDASKEPLLIAQGYVWYLQAFYDKEEETIIRSRDEIKELYDQCEDGKIKGYLFWLYMNLSEELMKDAKLRMELIKELYQEGCQNPLLQFVG